MYPLNVPPWNSNEHLGMIQPHDAPWAQPEPRQLQKAGADGAKNIWVIPYMVTIYGSSELSTFFSSFHPRHQYIQNILYIIRILCPCIFRESSRHCFSGPFIHSSFKIRDAVNVKHALPTLPTLPTSGMTRHNFRMKNQCRPPCGASAELPWCQV